MRASMVLSGTPASHIFVAAVCRRSCSRHFTPALSRKAREPQRSVMGRVGSLGLGLAKGIGKYSGFVSPNRWVNHAA